MHTILDNLPKRFRGPGNSGEAQKRREGKGLPRDRQGLAEKLQTCFFGLFA